MKKLTSFKHTMVASYIGYITQAIINNFAPLLFLTFESSYDIPLSKITVLVTVNFSIQLFIDLLSAKFVDKIGYRTCIVAAHLFCFLGLFGLGMLPDILPNPYVGLVISICIYAIGGGLIEVLISPIVESCPTERKAASMGLLHSFYCWGHMFVIMLSTLFFSLIGISSWKYLALFWSLIPLFNLFYFILVPINQLPSEKEGGGTLKNLFSSKVFLIFFCLMFLSGASEQSMSQWASAFAESALISSPFAEYAKVLGDLMGPCLFALMMGISRVIFSKLSDRIDLRKMMISSGIICILCYLVAAISSNPIVSLIGCGMCGFSVGIMWPGVFSYSTVKCTGVGTAMFALLSLAGDLGCAAGPSVVGFVADASSSSLKNGMLAAIVFPVLLTAGLIICGKVSDKKKPEKHIKS